MKRIIRVNARTREIAEQEATSEEQRIGGRHYIAYLLNREVPPNCEALGRHNKLIIAHGLFADTGVTTAGQLSIGGKSPLTGGVKESNTGGYAGRRIARLGIKAIIVEDIPEGDRTQVLYLAYGQMILIDTPELKQKCIGDTCTALRQRFGQKIGIICIGPAGEMKMYSAGIASVDDSDIQVRYAGRGGMGALMGSKGIKAIVVKDDRVVQPDFFDPELLKKTVRDIVQTLKDDPKSKNRKLYGTLDIVDMANTVGLLPTRNFSAGQFEPAREMTGPKFAALVRERGGSGRSGTPCVPGCTIQCSNVFPDQNGRKIVGSLQYESLVMLGPNLGISELDTIGELNSLCNEVGVDTIETGAALGVAMEAGILSFGDGAGAGDAIRQIGEGSLLGRIIGHGAAFTGRAFGVRRIPVVKGQAIPAYDPRALKGNGVTYGTSPMGADHTAGNAFETIRTNNPLGVENQVYNSRQLQVRAAILDSIGLCLFIRPAFVAKPGLLMNLFKAKFGWDISLADIRMLGAAVLDLERWFNEKAGVSEKFFPLPEFMREEALPPNNTVFDIPQEQLERIWEVPVEKEIF